MWEQFAKRTIYVAGTPFPFVQTMPPENQTVQTSQGRNIPTQFAWGLSLRTPNPTGPNAGGPAVLVASRENLGFTTLRDDHVVGLDVTAEGVIISRYDLEKVRGEAIMAQQKARAEAAQTAVVIDLEAVVADPA